MKQDHDSSHYAVPEIVDLYDSVPLYANRPDIQFYVDEASRSGGRVLEAGCGTGRVLIPTAREGVNITGIDYSSTMLDRCRERLALETEETQENVGLHEADIRDFDLGQTFQLATIPFRPFQHLMTVEDQLAALRSLRRHLEPGGRLVFDVFNPKFAALAAGATREKEDSPPRPLPDGRVFRRTSLVKAVRLTEQISDASIIYYVTDLGGKEERHVHEFSMRWFMRYEVEHLLALSGFAVRGLYGNFDRSTLADGSPELIFVAERL